MEHEYLIISYDTRDLNDPVHGLVMIIGKDCRDYINYYFLEVLSALNGTKIPYRERN